MKNCVTCGRELEPKRWASPFFRFCSRACQQREFFKTRYSLFHCVICDKEVRYQIKKGVSLTVCEAPECVAKLALLEKARDTFLNRERHRTKTIRRCPRCNKLFLNPSKATFCSPCSRETLPLRSYQNCLFLDLKANRNVHRQARTFARCPLCGKPLESRRFRYCSEECAQHAMQEKRPGQTRRWHERQALVTNLFRVFEISSTINNMEIKNER